LIILKNKGFSKLNYKIITTEEDFISGFKA